MTYFLFMLIFFLIATLFSFLNHPLSMGFILMIQTFFIAIFSGMISKSFWFSYSLFLIFLGGMLILFMYMTSLASNEQFYFNLKKSFNFKTFCFISILLILFIFLILNKNLIFLNKIQNLNNMNMLEMKNLFTENNFLLNKLYNFPMNFITILLMNYLFLTLIMTVKITNIFEGPLRPKN